MDDARYSAHDDYSFEQLSAAYNFQRTSDWPSLFVRLVADDIEAAAAPTTAIDIGCGNGIGGSLERLEPIRAAADSLWGIEPDTGISAPAAFDEFRHAEIETADLPEGKFDVAYSYMVMEHVVDPERFLRSVRACLKPGGSYMFLTVNGRHYFALATRTAHALKIDEALLRVVRDSDHVEDYHYPVQYRFNEPKVIDQLAARTGFEPPEYVFLEQEGPIDYMPGPLRVPWKALQWKRSVLKRPELLLTMVVRMRASGDTHF
jgi:SAM-dependent methyltransferase